MSRPTTQPSLSARLRKLALPIAVIAITAGATNAFGASPKLIAIPTLPGDTSNLGRAIVPDGLWVAGDSTGSSTRGFLYDVTGATVYNVLAIGQSTIAAGVCYRTSGGQQQVIVGGMAAGWNADYCFANGVFVSGSCRRDIYNTGGHPKPTTGIANTRASGGGDVVGGGWAENQDGPSYWAAISKVSGVWQGQSTTVANDYDTAVPSSTTVYGVSGTGRAVGITQSLTIYVWDWTGSGTLTAWQFNGMDGTTSGEPFAISADGTMIFGRSYSSDPASRPYLWPFKATFDTTMPGPATQLSINELPSFPDTAPSAGGSAGLPYGCTADGKYAVGYSYRGMEKAVVWDTSASDPAKWTVLDLTELAKLKGILGIFDGNLTRAYSAGTNAAGLVITGFGYDNTAGATRAFLMTVPQPPAPELTISNSGGGFTLNYLGLGNTTNVLEYTTGLNLPHTWTPLDTNSSGYITTYVDSAPPDQKRFYRVRTQ